MHVNVQVYREKNDISVFIPFLIEALSAHHLREPHLVGLEEKWPLAVTVKVYDWVRGAAAGCLKPGLMIWVKGEACGCFCWCLPMDFNSGFK